MAGRQVDELRAVAAELLGVPVTEETAATRSLVGLGGDSVLAMRLRALAATRLGVDVPLDELLGPAALHEALAAARPLPAAETTAAAPLAARADDGCGTGAPTPGQRGMWLAEQAVGGQLYHLVFTALFDGPLDTEALVRAVEHTVARHDGLRTSMDIVDGELVRVVHPVLRPVARVRSLGDAPFEERVRELADATARHPFDFAAGPLLRFLLVSGERDRHALVLVTHHIMLDAWAVGLVFREVLAGYAATTGEAMLLPPAPSPRTLVAHHRALAGSGELDRQVRWWATRLDGVPTVLELPTDRPRPARRGAGGARLPFALTPEQGMLVDAGARRGGVTPFALLLAAFALTVARHTGVRRMIVGVPTAGRPTEELQGLVAQCALVVPVVVTVDDDADTGDYLRHVQRSLLESMANGDVPLEVLAPRHAPAGDQGRNPLVQLVCGRYDQLVDWESTVGPLRVRVVEGHAGGSPMDVTVAFRQGAPAYGGTLEFATSMWHDTEAAAFLDSYLAAVAELAAAEGPLASVRAVPPADPGRDAAVVAPLRQHPTVHGRVLAHAVADPTAVALRGGERVVTYRQLAGLAAEHADVLRANGVAPGDLVAVGLPRSVALVVAVLGAWLAGATVLPLTASDTPRTVARALRAARPAATVADGLLARTVEGFGVPLVAAPDLADPPADLAPGSRAAPLALASGAPAFLRAGTGAHDQDGEVPHAVLCRLADECPVLGPGTRTVHWSPLWSDAAALEVWLPLMCGGEVEILTGGGPVAPATLARFVATRDVTALWTTDVLARAMVAAEPGCLAGVRHLMSRSALPTTGSAGVLLACGSAVAALALLPGDRDTAPAATGRCRVLDAAGRPLPRGAVGELHVAGDGGEHPTGVLARLSPLGTLRVLGVAEDRFDAAGRPVHAEDVAAELRAHRDVADAVALVTDAWGERELLVGYVTRRPGLDQAALAEWLATRVPRAAVPTRWVALPSLPLTATGELDRHRVVTAARHATGPVRSVA